MIRYLGIVLICLLAACARAQEDRLTGNDELTVPAEPVMVVGLLPELRSSSCPAGLSRVDGSPIAIVHEALPLGGDEDAALTEVTFGGAWHLTSEEPNFGGLSGLAALPSGDLMAVSDAGAFFWIGMTDGEPNGDGRVGYMRGADGNLLGGKRQGDSEGIDLVDGVALVSFERDHRVLAFDLAGCGANARGVLVTDIPDKPEGLPRGFRSNQGAEALMLDREGFLVVGLETGAAGPSESAISILTTNGMAFNQRLSRPNGPFLVGLDGQGPEIFGLFRSYARPVGNLIEVRSFTDLSGEGQGRIRLARPYTVDNFEGITTVRHPQ
ncbi:MAG: esterase-like activity of phytase family protein [Pseudomonadota bacterium]